MAGFQYQEDDFVNANLFYFIIVVLWLAILFLDCQPGEGWLNFGWPTDYLPDVGIRQIDFLHRLINFVS
jgi:hypothetical protein